MAPVSKKAKVARGKARHAGKFEKEKLDDQLAEIDDAVDLFDSDEEAIDFLDARDDAANWLLLVAPLDTDGDNARPKVYDGESDRTKRRNKAANLYALKACPMQRITSFFQSDTTLTMASRSSFNALDRLYANAKGLNKACFVQICVLSKFFEMRAAGESRHQAAVTAAAGMPTRMTRHIRTIQYWARHFELTGNLPLSFQGMHQKTKSLKHDEDFMAKCADWLKLQSPNQRTPQRFQKHLNENVLPLLTGAINTNVSENTARRWMHHVGYVYGLWKKGVYIDGHERDDVKAYRKSFCDMFLGYSDQMRFYNGPNMEIESIPPNVDAPEVVWITHDESVFYANDDGGKGWCNSMNPDLHKKGKGRSIMVSDFLCPCHGRLYNMEGEHKVFVTRVLHIGKNNEGDWTNEDVIKQVTEVVLSAFSTMHLGALGLFTFDQSTNHAAFSKDALRATSMNMKPGGKQEVLRPGRFADGSEQPMVFRLDHPLAGQPKGLKQVLEERGFDVEGLKRKCGNKEVDTTRGPMSTCCALHCMASQPDFRAQKSILEETILQAGHICLFLPKYHCELNPIESYWGASKRYARANCDYSFTGLEKCVPKSLESVSLSCIRKFFRRCTHFIEAYNAGCDYELAKFAHKKYKSHRRIPQSILQEKESMLSSS